MSKALLVGPSLPLPGLVEPDSEPSLEGGALSRAEGHRLRLPYTVMGHRHLRKWTQQEVHIEAEGGLSSRQVGKNFP